jgi:hypothetical protein
MLHYSQAHLEHTFVTTVRHVLQIKHTCETESLTSVNIRISHFGCSSVQSGRYVPTFWKTLLSPSSEYINSHTENKGSRLFWKVGTYLIHVRSTHFGHNVTARGSQQSVNLWSSRLRGHIREDGMLYGHCREDLKSCKLLYSMQPYIQAIKITTYYVTQSTFWK